MIAAQQSGLLIKGESRFKPTRSFSKRMLLANNVAAWAAIFISIWLGEGVANTVVPAMATFLFAAFSAYIGVGHMDLRASQHQQSYGYGGYGGYQSDLPTSEPYNPGDK